MPDTQTIVIAAVLLSPFVVGALLLLHLYRNHRMLIAAWQDVARRSGLECRVPPALSWRGAWPWLEGQLNGVSVKLAIEMPKRRDPHDFNHPWTKAWTKRAASVTTRVRIKGGGAFDKLGKLLGAQDLIVGDETFDRSFMIKTETPDQLGALLHPTLREALLALRTAIAEEKGRPTSLMLTYDGAIVDLRWSGIERSPRVLEAALKAISATHHS